MTAGGFARESVLSLLEGPQRHSPRDRAEALLAAIESVQQRTDLGQVAERAALTVVSLAAATAAVVYFEAAELGPQLAFAGGVSGTAAEALAAAVRDLVSSGNGAPYVLLAGATIVAAPFQIGKIRGAVLVERNRRNVMLTPLGEEVVNDYRFLELSLRAHPASFLRADLTRRGIIRNDTSRSLVYFSGAFGYAEPLADLGA